MVNQGPNRDRSELGADDDIDEILGRANPNRDRLGCPTSDVLEALARRERPIGDLGYEHLAECSACYGEFRAIRRADEEAQSASKARSPWLIAAAAAVVIAVVGIIWIAFSRAPEEIQRPNHGTDSFRTELDLRQFATVRSDQSLAGNDSVSLPRTLVTLSILLPVGSEAGEYVLEIRDAESQVRAATHGVAEIRNYITTLEATLDLRQLPAGSYQLAVQHQGDTWRTFPAHVR